MALVRALRLRGAPSALAAAVSAEAQLGWCLGVAPQCGSHGTLLSHQWRAAFSSTSGREGEEKQGAVGGSAKPATVSVLDEAIVHYVGPFSHAVKRVKALSVGSLAATFAATPIILAFQGDVGMTVAAKAGIATTLCGFGAFTTGLLHWFTAPYVHSLTCDKSTGVVDVETLTCFLKKRHAQFHLSEVGPTDSLSPISTFSARGVTYYIDKDNFPDKELLEQLTPRSPDDPGATPFEDNPKSDS